MTGSTQLLYNDLELHVFTLLCIHGFSFVYDKLGANDIRLHGADVIDDLSPSHQVIGELCPESPEWRSKTSVTITG